MAKSVGSPKTGGRKAGTPNKRTLAFGEVLELHGVDLLSKVLRGAESLSEAERLPVYLGLLPYQYPKRKPTETPLFSIDDYLSKLSKEETHLLWKRLNSFLGYDLEPVEMTIEQLQDFRSTLDSIIDMKRITDELGEPDDVTC
ncbi:hypothetical protein ACES2I_00480 [Bdellovibrio bacteriovorus]|uniref:hypothetical protein n=1 Tax=Bdellovibrio bacteriovorus TaxID=959 RepID=UPI0035A6DBFB